ncbi:electron transfer flavoprotein subunit alpha/FixB family protein [Paenibacillus hodogayensis]|uniref:Electron transfer flavoprotein subunit alpha/FixB family protein n=1 Tax=Paenibacillus hodogayensis TaxID=279208 RepID=A0ABV5W3U4_9BACL
MSRHILVVAELREGVLRQVSLEAVAAARLLAGASGTVSALLAGPPDSHGQALLAAGADRVVHTPERDDIGPAHTERALQAAAEAVGQLRPDAIVLGHTALGKDIAPRLAARLNAGQIADVIAIEPDGESFAFTRPIYAGKAFEKRMFTETPWVVTIRPNNFPPLARAGAASADVAAGEAALLATAGKPDLRTVVRGVMKRAAGKTDLAEAKVIVSGGRGVRGADGFKPLAELAEALNGAVGASRGACDAGYCDYSLQIGQTGKVVTPELYIACGISGAIQHVAGMSGSRVIVAINKDPEAPIFKIADYGIVGDLFEVVPLLTEEIRRLPASR